MLSCLSGYGPASLVPAGRAARRQKRCRDTASPGLGAAPTARTAPTDLPRGPPSPRPAASAAFPPSSSEGIAQPAARAPGGSQKQARGSRAARCSDDVQY